MEQIRNSLAISIHRLALVEPWSAVVIGATVAPVMMVSLIVTEQVLKIDTIL